LRLAFFFAKELNFQIVLQVALSDSLSQAFVGLLDEVDASLRQDFAQELGVLGGSRAEGSLRHTDIGDLKPVLDPKLVGERESGDIDFLTW